MPVNEWAHEPNDVIWRLAKAGVHLSPAVRRKAHETLAAML